MCIYDNTLGVKYYPLIHQPAQIANTTDHKVRLQGVPSLQKYQPLHSLNAINTVYNKNSYLDERREALELWN